MPEIGESPKWGMIWSDNRKVEILLYGFRIVRPVGTLGGDLASLQLLCNLK
jgi:hypothetical protein